MFAGKFKKTLLVPLLIIAGTSVFVFSTGRQKIDFSTQVKPIINKKCITCHGGVKRESGFSLLFREEALAKTRSGKPAIVPGDPGASEMIRRLHLKDPEERMPYKHQPLSDDEINILTQWVKQGAKWGEHWAYVAVKPVEVPKAGRNLFGLLPADKWEWPKNDIDYFIYDALQKKDIKPSPPADKAMLLRRVSLDITGLPPTQSLTTQFLSGKITYDILVDSLLASAHYGERWTAMWLDLARYADTKGYERDAGRSIWRYRDWLIKSFNEDKPYDQFLTEQLAGDLLPDATNEQFIATAFHRNTMTNDEGGTENEEFRTAAVMDRVNTTWTALMGTTFNCVQCHSHPYDPFKHDEYYKFMAFFNNSRDEDTWADYPLLRYYNEEDSIRRINVVSWLKKNNYGKEAHEADLFLRTWQPSINSINTDSFINCELSDTKWLTMRNASHTRLKHINLDKKTQLMFRYIGYAANGVWTIRVGSKEGPVLKRVSIPKTKGWSIMKIDFPQQAGVHDLYFSYSNSTLKTPDASGIQFDWFYFTTPLPGKGLPGYDSTAKNYWNLVIKDVPGTPVMMDNPSDMYRHGYVFERGNWLVKGKEVFADVPQSLNPFPKGAPHNRLGLAMWLTDKRNPLTARTIVNRLWEQLFGNGIVETLEDMGSQGIEPTHRELLDHLAYRLMNDHHWSIKKLLKEMVSSATYCEDSKVSEESLEKDPYNKYYSRGARVRLSAEQMRDQALALSGLLCEKLGGPSVMPWQPGGIWLSPWNGEYWKKSEGEDQYRRAVYTYWKRTAPYPSMITFDGVGREVCTARRIRTNTPLQALVTLNDSAYLDAARHFAYKLEKENIPGIRQKINKAYEQTLYKPAAPAKLNALETLYYEALRSFKKDSAKTCEMIGENNEHNNPETAAMVVVMNALLNLDEVVTKF
ncbi:MAG: hypothetical protein JWN76_2682 [Chitinophagaceae bacterium]|nr:hypothetical protein [Chitinophagaceae bacterium]